MTMILGSLTLLPLLTSYPVYVIGRWRKERSFWLAFLLSLSYLVISVVFLVDFFALQNGQSGLLLAQGIDSRMYFYLESEMWIPLVNVTFSFGLDGLSLSLVVLSTFIILLVVLAARLSISRDKWPAFYMLVLITESGLLGTFLAADMIVFIVFWELVLIPMFFIILFYGHGNHVTSAYVFFIYTHVGGLFLVIGILGSWIEAQALTNGAVTFFFEDWAYQIPWSQADAFLPLLVMFMFIAFLIKLPVFPLHSWLPRAHVDAPTPGSMILAGLLLKMGGYGILRFGIWFFPDIIVRSWLLPVLSVVAVLSIIIIAGVAFRQDDLKRLVAFSSIVHMNMALLGFLASVILKSEIPYIGSVLMLIAHGILSPGMFYVVGEFQRFHGTRSISWLALNVNITSRHSLEALLMFVMFLGSMGFPTLAEFVPKFLMLLGVLEWDLIMAIVYIIGAILMMATFMWAMARLFFSRSSFVLNYLRSSSSMALLSSRMEKMKEFDDDAPFEYFLRLIIASIFIMTAFYLGIFPHIFMALLG